jgi:hypothetical protein
MTSINIHYVTGIRLTNVGVLQSGARTMDIEITHLDDTGVAFIMTQITVFVEPGNSFAIELPEDMPTD